MTREGALEKNPHFPTASGKRWKPQLKSYPSVNTSVRVHTYCRGGEKKNHKPYLL